VPLDLLAGVSADWMRALTWLVAILSGLLLFFWRRRVDLAALGSVIVFMVASAGAGTYVLHHLGDDRWRGGTGNRLTVPSLSETPVVGQFMEPVDSFMESVAGSVNQFLDFQEALPAALDFFVAAGWALLVSLPLALLVMIVGYVEARRRKAEFDRYKLQVEELRAELNDLKQHLNYSGRG
jgi:hypothetical protein